MPEFNFKRGDRVSYADSNATVSDGVEGVRTGLVNGPPVRNEDQTETYWPLWSERDNGREPTTVYVPERNILGRADEEIKDA